MPTRVLLDTLNLITLLGSNPVLQPTAGSMTLTPIAADITNKAKFTVTGKEILVVVNANASPATVTITSVPDERNRTGDITTYSVAAGDTVPKVMFFGPVQLAGWRQTDGYVYVEASAATLFYGVIRLP